MNASDFLKVGIVADDKTKKGISSAQKNVNSLNKSVKTLGKTFAAVFAARKIMAFGKDSVKAFIEDEKAVTKLNTAVKNLGLELSAPSINKYIDNLSKVSGVADDQLRPAFQALITTTGSVTASQKALQQAIDISAGSGIELTTVSQDLANAYVGNTKGLKKYNLGLTQAQLKTAKFADISEMLNKQFSGANAAYLETYAGKITLLTVAAGEAQEKIGQGILDLALAVSGATDVEDLINKIATATDFAVARLDNFIEGWKILRAIINSPLGDFKKAIQDVQVEEFNRRLKRDYMKVFAGTNIPKSPQQIAAERAAADAAKKRAKDLEKLLKTNTAELKKQAALKKAGTVFDLEQIQLVAALKGKLSDNEKLRVEAQLALLNGNEAVATKLTNQILMAQDASGNLAKFLSALPNAKNPFEYLDAYLSYLAGKAAAVLTGTTAPNVPSTNATAAPMPTASEMAASGSFSQLVSQGAGASGGFSPVVAAAMAPVINVTVQGNVIREQELINQVLAGAQLSSLSGSPSQIGRIAGMFS
jgi:hypothetical protein